ncbi:hypothetical protein F0562_004045 [Nyssa sinensis]|uniref:Uncharacterized protein n=1 Tax=Nyssa sinensis TaxID=561372 RepID=A0A5J5BY93_9ASTE|nr:hypothetical protein F0562_004045 [Nyssa sinensis]
MTLAFTLASWVWRQRKKQRAEREKSLRLFPVLVGFWFYSLFWALLLLKGSSHLSLSRSHILLLATIIVSSLHPSIVGLIHKISSVRALLD